MIAPLLACALAAPSISPELEAVAARMLPLAEDAAAILDLNTGRLIFEHHPLWIAERRIVPGSVMKLFTAYALLDGGLADRETRCTGTLIDHYGTERACWIRTGHGQVRFTRAIADSCNIWFYTRAEELAPEAWLRALEPFGLGAPIDTDVRGAVRDLVPSVIAPRDLPDFMVGDALAMEVSPLSLLRAVSVIATQGRRITPVRARAAEIDQPALERAHLLRIAEAMEEAVESGTLSESMRGVDAAAKTGTAKKRGEKGTRGLVLGYAPRRDPRFAFVIVKGEGRGAVDAGPAAAALVKALLGSKR